MKKFIPMQVFVTGLLALACAPVQAAESKQIEYVRPLIGTGAVDKNSLSGENFPGATTPFGLVQLSPDTRDVPSNSGYNYNDKTIFGFSHTHLSGTGVGDLYDILVMPFTGAIKENRADYASAFSHDHEQAQPGYYQVKLLDSQINAELTASAHVGFHRYTFPQSEQAHILIDLDHSAKRKGGMYPVQNLAQIKIVDNRTIEGYRIITGWCVGYRKIYFRAEFSKPFTGVVLMNAKKKLENPSVVNSAAAKAVLNFTTAADEAILVKVGLSTTSPENARLNLVAEVDHWDFNQTRQAAAEAWEKELKAITIEGTQQQKEIFYTCLYHAFIQPNNLADVNGDYTGTDLVVRKSPDKKHYSTFSLWDTYRAAHPLYTLIQPRRDAEFVASMLRQYDTFGYLPVWQLWGLENDCMIGNHAIPVVVDAALKGLRGVDAEKAYAAVRGSALTDHYSEAPYHGSAPVSALEQYGYIPEDVMSQSVSMTLEIAYDDWCVAQLAKKLGKTDDYNRFMKRSSAYKNLFDAQTKFFRGRDKAGNFLTPFDPYTYGGNGNAPYTEGNAWHYLFYVPQDVPGLIGLMGGKEAFLAQLDAFFSSDKGMKEKNPNASGFIGQYAHGNEPSHHAAYLYNFAGQPWKTQKYVAQVLNTLYNNSSSGYPGNEDCGQMSSWYILSAMGFYPVNPANGVYVIGSPILQSAVLQLGRGKTFTVWTKNVSPENVYIQSAKLNGKDYTRTYITHTDIVQGGTLELIMGAKPNTHWGVNAEDAPPAWGY